MKESDIELIAAGADSTVCLFKEKNIVLKIYDRLIAELDWGACPEKALDLIKIYAEDTLNVATIIDSEWTNVPQKDCEIVLGKKTYSINFTILPQGEPELVPRFLSGENFRDEIKMFEKYAASIGQRFVADPNIQDILYSRKEFNPIFDSIRYQPVEEKSKIDNVKSLLTEIIGSKSVLIKFDGFNISGCNIKPIINEKEMILNLVITDLSNDLIFSYESYLEDKCNYFIGI